MDLSNPGFSQLSQLRLEVIDLDKDVVASTKEVPGSNAFVTKDWVGRLFFNCILYGERLVRTPEEMNRLRAASHNSQRLISAVSVQERDKTLLPQEAWRGGGPPTNKIPTRYQQDSATLPRGWWVQSVHKLDKPFAGGSTAGRSLSGRAGAGCRASSSACRACRG